MKKTNAYGWYTAEYCRSTGLPMFDKKSYGPFADIYLSQTRCKKCKMPVQEGEEPSAFYKVDRGYCALYDRRKTGGVKNEDQSD